MGIKNITIVGGGSAGWMTASTLIKAFPNKKITVIESPDVPIIGVGESTLNQMKYWTNFLGIDDKEFMPACDATYKLGIMFKDFYKKAVFVKVLNADTLISTNDVINSNNCYISICKSKYKNKIIILSAIDNLIKGGAGQAVQNLNMKFKFPLKTALL